MMPINIHEEKTMKKLRVEETIRGDVLTLREQIWDIIPTNISSELRGGTYSHMLLSGSVERPHEGTTHSPRSCNTVLKQQYSYSKHVGGWSNHVYDCVP